ncbi:hypothetical protein BDD43_1684 [Mucilaginibacter gracilis]|uniref:Uncharacterized protein n=1 Tax=Mucilaginibacter gracilis TaxID=423350 RepID=A0A495IXW2_9SPHI|nr:hypothetical protein BDD43_1684 [Mucilaginibacter gracilis]
MGTLLIACGVVIGVAGITQVLQIVIKKYKIY